MVEDNDLENAHSVDINVKEAGMNGDNVDINVLLGKINEWVWNSAQNERLLKTIEGQNLRIVTLEKQVKILENENDDQKKHINVLKQRVSVLEVTCGKPINPEHHNGHTVVIQNDQGENIAVSRNVTSV